MHIAIPLGNHDRARSPRAGLSGIWMFLAFLVLVLLAGGGCAVSKYNGLVSSQERVAAQWSEIENQYKRRYDLVPQLVETVKGAADFEKSTITEVTEARAAVGKTQLTPTLPEDPAKLQAFFEAQRGLSSALSRLLVTVENYPQLKASANFLSLQDQLEGTENRIAVARRDYIDAVKSYNTNVRRFPNNLLANTFGFVTLPQLQSEEDVTQRPDVDFGGG
jgi:LemA protein